MDILTVKHKYPYNLEQLLPSHSTPDPDGWDPDPDGWGEGISSRGAVETNIMNLDVRTQNTIVYSHNWISNCTYAH